MAILGLIIAYIGISLFSGALFILVILSIKVKQYEIKQYQEMFKENSKR